MKFAKMLLELLTKLMVISVTLTGRCQMRGFVLLVILFASSSLYAQPPYYGTCKVILYGPYPTEVAARDACWAARGDSRCGYAQRNPPQFPMAARGYLEEEFIVPNHPIPYGTIVYEGSVQFQCPEPKVINYNHIYHVYTIGELGCPPGTAILPDSNGVCVCEEGEMNYETQLCEDPKCQPPTTYNEATGLCEKECPTDKPWSDTARDCVAPPEPESCDNKAGNPIDFFSGHKLQEELVFETSGDFPITFSLLYNSFGNHRKTGAGYSVGSKIVAGGGTVLLGDTILHTEPPIVDGAARISLPLDINPYISYTGNSTEHWRHNHSYFLGHYVMADGITERLIAYRPDGSDFHFVEDNGSFVALANRNWRITKGLDGNQELIGWTLRQDGRIEKYDTGGRILRIENQQGKGLTYTYDSQGKQLETITNDNGKGISLDYTDGKLTGVFHQAIAWYWLAYNENGLLESISFPGGAQKTFRYEDSRFPNALTGVTDEAGRVYSTFTYDDQGRAIRTEHNGSAEAVDVEYVDTNTRRLTNALGKSTTYTFSDVGNGKRITSIDGEASVNCAAANKGYTYDANGFVASETDWEGNVTTYTRDNLGRELIRTEAAGTASEQAITTEWHSELNVPVKVTTPEDVTVYTYDSSGRLLGKKVTPVAGP